MKQLTVIFFCMYVSSVFSQGSEQSVFSLKAAFGINGCQIHGDNYSGYDKGGLFFGAAVNAALKKKNSFELGFYFSQKGAKHNANPEKGDYNSYNLRLNYLDMPLLFKFDAGKRFFLTAGPSVAYLISYREIVNSSNTAGQSGATTFNKFEVGINAGIGANLNDVLSFELRTSNSILPVHDYGVANSTVYYSNPIAQFFNEGWYNNILTLFVSYRIK